MCEINWSFFDSDFFKDLISALIGTGTALLIFYMTLRGDRKKARNEENEQNKRRLNYLSNVVTATKNQIENSLKNLKSSIEKFDGDNLNFHLLTKNPNSSLDRLNEILNNENYFLAYLKQFGKKKIKKFNNISLQVDFFIDQEKQIWDMTQSAQQFDYKRKQSFVEIVNRLMQTTAKTLHSNILDQNYTDKVNIIIKDFYDNIKDRSNLNFYSTHFIQPMISEVLIHNLQKPVIVELIAEFTNVSNLFSEIKLQNTRHKEDLQEIVKNYSESLEFYVRDASDLIIEKKTDNKKSIEQ